MQENLYIFFFVGHETTAKDQEGQEHARQEVLLHHLGDAPEDTLPTLEDTMKLIFISQIMKETMRMYGPVSGILPRITTQDTFIDGAFISKHTFVSVSIFRLHHNKKYGNHTMSSFLRGLALEARLISLRVKIFNEHPLVTEDDNELV